jgi:hypothetical protein
LWACGFDGNGSASFAFECGFLKFSLVPTLNRVFSEVDLCNEFVRHGSPINDPRLKRDVEFRAITVVWRLFQPPFVRDDFKHRVVSAIV